MPSKSKSQMRLMAAAAHTPGGYGGVPQSVGKDFNAADKKAGKRTMPMRKGPEEKQAPTKPRGIINRAG